MRRSPEETAAVAAAAEAEGQPPLSIALAEKAEQGPVPLRLPTGSRGSAEQRRTPLNRPEATAIAGGLGRTADTRNGVQRLALLRNAAEPATRWLNSKKI